MKPTVVAHSAFIAAVIGVAAIGTAHANPPAPFLRAGGVSTLVLVQARNTNLAGVWTSAAGDKFDITVDGDKVLMATAGTLNGRISGNFDGAAFSGAYQTAATPPDRGVVRFLLNESGKLEGTWQSYVTGKHGEWALTRK